MKTPARNILGTQMRGTNLALALLLLCSTVRAATFPNRVTTNSDSFVSQVAVNVIAAGAKGGANDDTAILNTLLSQGGRIFFPPTNYSCGRLFITNNCEIYGYGARIDFNTNLTATTNLVFATNVDNVLIQGLTFNGGNTNDCYTVVRSTNTDRVLCNPCINKFITFRDVRAFGYDFGIVPAPFTDGITVQQLPHVRFDNVELSTNAYGLYCQSTTATNLAEYIIFSSLIIHDCSFGAWLGGGNLGVIGCNLSHNNVAIQVDGTGGLNPGHGLIIGNLVNHGNGSDIECNNLGASGEYIQGNIFAAGSAKIGIDGCQGVVVTGNHFRGGGGVSVGTGYPGTNYVYDNDYTGQWKNPGFTVFDFAVNSYAPTTNLVSWSNVSIDTPGSDDPFIFDPFNTNVTYLNSGIISTASNRLAPSSVTFTGSPQQITNTFGRNMFLIVDGGTAYSAAINGTTVQSSLAGGLPLPLQTNEWVTITYTVAPSAFWKPY